MEFTGNNNLDEAEKSGFDNHAKEESMEGFEQNTHVNGNEGHDDEVIDQANDEVVDQNDDEVIDQDEEHEAVLPENVTEEPQDPEHMDLRGISNYPKWLPSYLKVSDDRGQFLGDTATEQEAQILCDELKDLKGVSNPEEMIARIMDLLNRYSPLINQAENTATGFITKYKIRWGMLLNALKELVKMKQGMKWVVWFRENFGDKLLRSAQDYMRIADVSNAIRYAVFGKERLLQIVKQLGDRKSDDPIGDFLREKGITFNVNVVQESDEIRKQTDIAVARSQLEAKGLGHVPEDKVAAFIESGHQFKPALIEQMSLVEKVAGRESLPKYIDELILAGGKVRKPILTPQVKARTYKHTLSKFLDMTRSAISDTHYLGEINSDLITQLKQTIMELETKLTQKVDN